MREKNESPCNNKVFLVHDKATNLIYVIPIDIIIEFQSCNTIASSPSLKEISQTTYHDVEHFVDKLKKLDILGSEKIRRYKMPEEKGISYQLYFADTVAQILKSYTEEFPEKYPQITAPDTNYAECLKSPERMAEKVAEFFTGIDPTIPRTSQFIANLVRDELRDWLEKPQKKERGNDTDSIL